ncbi:MAG: hypothetical protein LBP29_10070 [Treponema sp.]|jgi:hypothetical protein|nr:hypothetical protein [Treponema sp.]
MHHGNYRVNRLRKKKTLEKKAARDLYLGALFRKSLAYAKTLRPRAIYVLSAKYGLVPLDRRIEPYDLTLKTQKAPERRAWAAGGLKALEKASDLKKDRFIILAGQRYREYLVPRLRDYTCPLEGMGTGIREVRVIPG